MKTIDSSFTNNGFEHKLIERNGEWAIFKRWKAGFPYTAHYEVVRIRANPSWVAPNGTLVPAGEAYPTNERWGVDGFTHDSLERAIDRMKELQQAKPRKTCKKT